MTISHCILLRLSAHFIDCFVASRQGGRDVQISCNFATMFAVHHILRDVARPCGRFSKATVLGCFGVLNLSLDASRIFPRVRTYKGRAGGAGMLLLLRLRAVRCQVPIPAFTAFATLIIACAVPDDCAVALLHLLCALLPICYCKPLLVRARSLSLLVFLFVSPCISVYVCACLCK